ncbi:unnamed protein product [Absidia cylindrospora]
MFLAHVPLWRVNYALAGLPALIQTILMVSCVESPRWLISVNRIDDAHHALQKLRGSRSIDREFYEMVEGQLGEAAATSALKYLHLGERHRPSMVSGQETLVEQPPLKEKEGLEQQQQHHDDDDEEEGDERRRLDSTMPPNEKAEDRDDASEDDDDDDDDDDNDEEMMGTGEKRHPKEHQASVKQVFSDPVMRRMVMTVVGLHVLQAFTGLNAIFFYSSMVFAAAYDDPHMTYSMATVDTAVFLVMTVVAVALMDRMGRRPLLLVSLVGVTLFSIVVFLGGLLHLPALLVVGVLMYMATFALGMHPIPWLLTVDMCPTYASSTIGAVSVTVHWLANFVVALFFPVVFAAIQAYTFLIFAGVGLIALVFTWFYVPETKNRSIESVVREFEKYRR